MVSLLNSGSFPSAPFHMNRTMAQNIAFIPVRKIATETVVVSTPKPASEMLVFRAVRIFMFHTAYPGTYQTPQYRAQKIPMMSPMRIFVL